MKEGKIKVKEYLENFIEDYFCKLEEGETYCPACGTLIDFDDREGLSDC